MNMLYIYLGVYIAGLIIISLWAARRNSTEDFLIAGRNRKSWQIMASKFAASIGVSWFIAYTAYAYEFGISVLWLVPSFLLSFPLFALWAAPRIYRMSREKKFYTQGDFVAHRLQNTRSKKVVDSVSITIYFAWLLTSFIGGAKVVSYLGIFSYEVALILTIVVVMGYILISGFRIVLLTDVLQSLIILSLLLLSVTFLFGNYSLIEVLSIESAQISVGFVIGFMIYGFFSIFGSSERYQLCFAAESERAVKRGLTFVVLPILGMVLLLLIVGLFVFSQDPTLDPDLAFVHFYLTHLPEAFLPLGAVLFFAGLMSSADTNIYVISSHFAFLKKRVDPVRTIRLTMIVLLGVSMIIAFFVRDIVDAVVFAAGWSLVTSIAMIYVIANGRSVRKFFASIFGAIIAFIIGLFIVNLTPTVAIFPVIGGILGLLWPKEKSEDTKSLDEINAEKIVTL